MQSAQTTQARVLSLNIGRPQIMLRGDRRVSTSINRKPVTGPRRLTREGFEADSVSDQSVHGGPDKAANCYPHEHYAHFAALLGGDLAIPSFGENLTLEGLPETEVCIGDTFRIGAALVQVSQPRLPCSKLAMKHNQPRLPQWVLDTGFTGWYFRVLDEGEIAAGDTGTLVDRPHPAATIAAVSGASRPGNADSRTLLDLAALPELAAVFRQRLQRLAAGPENA